MAYIGFLLIMLGLAAAGGAIDQGSSLIGAMAMTAIGAALMKGYGEEDKDGEEEDNGPAPCGGAHVDKPAGERPGGSGADQACGGGTGRQDDDNGVSPRGDHRHGEPYQTGNLRGTQGVGRKDGAGMGMQRF